MTIITILTLLLLLDPLNALFVGQYGIVEQSPIFAPDRSRRFGMSHWNPPYIAIDLPLINDWPVPGGKEDHRVWAACVLAHEAAHLRFQARTEDIPLAMQYVCLDRLGAAWYLKQMVYQQMLEAIVPPTNQGVAD